MKQIEKKVNEFLEEFRTAVIDYKDSYTLGMLPFNSQTTTKKLKSKFVKQLQALSQTKQDTREEVLEEVRQIYANNQDALIDGGSAIAVLTKIDKLTKKK